MEEVWRYLDHEYGRDDKLAAEIMAYLHAFQYSKSAQAIGAKFKELHACWREVSMDSNKVGASGNLDNPHALNAFVSKFPDSCHERFIILKNTPGTEDKKASEIVNDFMIIERELQSQ